MLGILETCSTLCHWHFCMPTTSWDRPKLQSFAWHVWRGWRQDLSSRVSSLTSIWSIICATFAVWRHLRQHCHSTCNGVSVRQLCEIWIFNANAGGQKRTWLDAWTLHNIRVLHVLHTYKLISSKLCRHCAATEHNLGRSGSKDKPACVNSNSTSNLQHTRSKPCNRGPLPVSAARRSFPSCWSSCWRANAQFVINPVYVHVILLVLNLDYPAIHNFCRRSHENMRISTMM